MAPAGLDKRGGSAAIRRVGHSPSPYVAPPTPEHEPPHEAAFDGALIGLLLRRQVRLIVGVALVVFALTVALTFHERMSFVASGRMYLGELEGKPMYRPPEEKVDLTRNEPTDLGSEVEIIQSESLVKSAVLSSGLNVTLSLRGKSPPRFWRWLLSHRDPRVFAETTNGLRAINTSLLDDSRGSQEYQLTFIDGSTYRVSQDATVLGEGKLGGALELRSVRIELHQASGGPPVAGSEYTLRVSPLAETEREVQKTFHAIVPRPLDLMQTERLVALDFESTSPTLAAAFLRELMEGYLARRQSWKSEDSFALEQFTNEQVRALRASLEQAEAELAEYRSTTTAMALRGEASTIVAQLGRYEAQRVAAKLQIATYLNLQRALSSPDSQLESFMFGEAEDQVLQEQTRALSETQRELTFLETRFGAAASEVREKRTQLDAQRATVRNYVGNRITRAQQNVATLSQVIAEQQSKLKTVPGAQQGRQQLERESEVYRRLYSKVLERQQQAGIVKASHTSRNRVLDWPQIPHKERSPVLAMRLLSFPIGLLFGAALALLRVVFSDSLRSVRDLRAVAGPISVLCRVHHAPLELWTRTDTQIDVVRPDRASAAVEAFRMLTAQLHRAASSHGDQVIMITSPCPGDGKTTCAVALARLLSAEHKRVLLVDADLHYPSHHRLFQTPGDNGLSSVLRRELAWSDAVRLLPSTHGMLDVMSAGARFGDEVLARDRLASFLEEVRPHYDFILLDAPSFPLLSDALVLARVSDVVLSVMRVQATKRRTALEHRLRLEAESRAYGIIANGAHPADA